jgi:hypothetical protein
MEKTEKTLIALIVIGQPLRIFDMVGGSLISITAALLLAVLYIFFGFALFNGIRFLDIFRKGSLGIGKRQIGLSVLLGFALAFSIIGIVFKLQIFTEANSILWAGIGLLVISQLLLKFRESRLYERVFPRAIGIGLIAIVLLITPATWLVDAFYFRDPDFAEIIKERVIRSAD